MPFLETCVVEEKARFCVAYEQGDMSMAELCRQYGVSRKTGYQVIDRWLAGGPAGLGARSHAPRTCPHSLSAQQTQAVLGLRRVHPTWGPKKLKASLEMTQPDLGWPAASTIGDLLARHGLSKTRPRRRRIAPATQPFATCASPNDLWSMDFKGWFRTLDGQRCDPFTLQDQASRFLLRLVPVGATNTDAVWAVLEAALREFGLPRAIRSDNGPPFGSTGAGRLSALSVRLIKAGILPDWIDPASPQQNGRLERMHRDLKAETAKPPAQSLAGQARRFIAFRRIYNEERPHEAVGLVVPASLYRASPRPWSGRLRSPDYGADCQVRQVRGTGEIKWRGRLIYLNSALAGEPVGITKVAEDRWSVRFGPVLIGYFGLKGKLERPQPIAAGGRRARDAFRSDGLPHQPETVTPHAG